MAAMIGTPLASCGTALSQIPLLNVHRTACRINGSGSVSYVADIQLHSTRIVASSRSSQRRADPLACSANLKVHAFQLSPASEEIPSPTRPCISASATSDASAGDVASNISERVLVVGATGGVGQLCVASLLAKGRPVRAVVRSVEKAKEQFADALKGDNPLLEIVVADLRDGDKLQGSGLADGVGSAIVCVGTTAFPSKRWQDNNGPEQTGTLMNFFFHGWRLILRRNLKFML